MPTLRRAAAASLLGLVPAGPALAAGQTARPLRDRVLVLHSHVDVPLDLGIGPHEIAIDGDGQVDLPLQEISTPPRLRQLNYCQRSVTDAAYGSTAPIPGQADAFVSRLPSPHLPAHLRRGPWR